jgi:phospholipase A1/A2
MPSPSNVLTLSTTLGMAMMASPMAAQAQAAPTALAECAAIAADSERLACFDRISGRGVRPQSEPKKEAAAAPPASPASTDGTTTTVAAPSPAGSGSMYDYTTDLNTAPFDPLVGGGVLAPGTELDSTEAAFQLSFKFRLWATDDRRWGAWAAYTQQSQWQLYNDSGNASRPFRETNYMPELILSYKPALQWGDLQWNLLNVAFNHQSNGRSDTLSRSWNRLIASFGVEQGNLGVLARVWWRVSESSDSDDNPTISDYYGWGDLSAIYKWRGQSFSGTLRGNPGTGKGAAQLAWTSAPLLGPLRGYVKLFSGYGETLIDYNWNQTTFGIGVTLNDWL